MTSTTQTVKGRDGVVSALDAFIRAINLAKDTCSILPAQVALGFAMPSLRWLGYGLCFFAAREPRAHGYSGPCVQQTGFH